MSETQPTGTAAYGNSAYGAGGNFPKNFKIKGDDKDPNAVNKSTFRILPPMHAQVRNPKGWKLYQKVHYGYSGVDPREAGKTRARPFVCPKDQDYRTKMIRVDCAECQRIEVMKERLEQVAVAVKGKDAAEQAARIGPLKEWLKKHNLQAKWKLNVLDLENQPGDLLISHRTMKDLDALFQELHSGGIDPLHPNQGVFVEFTRFGNGFTNPDKVVVVKNKITVEGHGVVEKVKLAPLTDDIATAAWQICRDLADTTPAVGLSQDQINMLTTCDGSPEEVDKIFAMSQSAAKSARPAQAQQTFRPEPAVETNAALETVTAPPTEDDEEAAAMKALLAARARKAAAAQAQATVQVPPVVVPPPVVAPVIAKASGVGVGSLSNEEFAAMYPELNV